MKNANKIKLDIMKLKKARVDTLVLPQIKFVIFNNLNNLIETFSSMVSDENVEKVVGTQLAGLFRATTIKYMGTQVKALLDDIENPKKSGDPSLFPSKSNDEKAGTRRSAKITQKVVELLFYYNALSAIYTRINEITIGKAEEENKTVKFSDLGIENKVTLALKTMYMTIFKTFSGKILDTSDHDNVDNLSALLSIYKKFNQILIKGVSEGEE